MTEILSHLYLSSAKYAKDPSFIQNYCGANIVHVHACARYESNPTSKVLSYFVRWYIYFFHVDFRVFFGCDRAFVIVHIHVL